MLNSLNFLIINCFGYENDPNGYDLLMFALGSFIIISILNLYYNRISKTSKSSNDLQNPIYQTKDILLQSNSADANFVIAKKPTSTWVKVLVFVLIYSIAFTPFQEFLGL